MNYSDIEKRSFRMESAPPEFGQFPHANSSSYCHIFRFLSRYNMLFVDLFLSGKK